jgi:hypothetical protein
MQFVNSIQRGVDAAAQLNSMLCAIWETFEPGTIQRSAPTLTDSNLRIRADSS